MISEWSACAAMDPAKAFEAKNMVRFLSANRYRWNEGDSSRNDRWIELRFLDGMSVREIGNRFGCCGGNVNRVILRYMARVAAREKITVTKGKQE